MPFSKVRTRFLLRVVQIPAIMLVSLLLILTIGLIVWESRWVEPAIRGPQDAFFNGTIGTEVIPLPVIKVLPDMFPEHYQPAGREAGDWIEQFGFIRAPEPNPDGLPLGFVSSNYRPQSGAPSPVKFVGFSCVMCHSTKIKDVGGGTEHIVIGPGNASLNLFAWVDALQAAVLDEGKFTTDKIAEAYQKKYGQSLSLTEKAMISLWLREFRGTLKDNLPKYDDPFGNGQSREPEAVPTGPGRTQPFRTLVRRVLERPGTTMAVYTKIAPVYHEDWKEWAQVDGSIRDLYARSSLAAYAAGATVDNMSLPEIVRNIRHASDYTRTLAGPKFTQLFPNAAGQLSDERIARGRELYMQHCQSCHGQPDPATGAWIKGPRQGEITPLAEIGTDPERITFRHGKEIADKAFDLFPIRHPFRFQRGDIRTTAGYINNPIDSAFSRAPYLHNASILTLAELINLKPRRNIFFRGNNAYDPVDAGLYSPDRPDGNYYFRFDTSLRGNSNHGHNYPWEYHGEGWDATKLEDLLQYLKML